MDAASIRDIRDLVDVLKTGGPYAVTAVFIFFFVRERRETRRLTDKIIAMAENSVAATVAQTTAVTSLRDMLFKLFEVFKPKGG